MALLHGRAGCLTAKNGGFRRGQAVKPSGEEMEEWMCFNTFGQTFFTLFVLSTGEHWNAIMHEVMDSPDGPGELIAVG